MKKLKKILLSVVLLIFISGQVSLMYAESLDSVMQQFKAAQAKLRDLRQKGASPSEIAAQEAKIKELRNKVSKLQSEEGQ